MPLRFIVGPYQPEIDSEEDEFGRINEDIECFR